MQAEALCSRRVCVLDAGQGLGSGVCSGGGLQPRRGLSMLVGREVPSAVVMHFVALGTRALHTVLLSVQRLPRHCDTAAYHGTPGPRAPRAQAATRAHAAPPV